MNITEFIDFCQSLGTDVKEDMSREEAVKENAQIFYVCDRMFEFYHGNDEQVLTLMCQPERIAELKKQYDYIGKPYNPMSSAWMGINPYIAPDDLLKDLIRNSYELTKEKYGK